MAGGSTGFHEADNTLTPATRDMDRAIVSLMEELEAIASATGRVVEGGAAEHAGLAGAQLERGRRGRVVHPGTDDRIQALRQMP